MNTTDPNFLISAIQSVSTGLLLLSLWVAKQMWSRLNELEQDSQKCRLQVQKDIAEVKFETLTRIIALENKGNKE